MYKIGTIVQSGRAEQAKRFLPAGLSVCPASGSTRMTMQRRFPHVRSSDCPMLLFPQARRFEGPLAGFGFRPSSLTKLKRSQILVKKCRTLRCARGRNQVEMLCAAIELCSYSADSHYDNNLDSQSRSTPCED